MPSSRWWTWWSNLVPNQLIYLMQEGKRGRPSKYNKTLWVSQDSFDQGASGVGDELWLHLQKKQRLVQNTPHIVFIQILIGHI